MTTIFRLNEKEFTDDVVNTIRAAFKNKEIEITISDVFDGTEYLLSTEANRKHLQRSMNDIAEGKGISFTLNELQEKYGK
jgi:hypothetical protein